MGEMTRRGHPRAANHLRKEEREARKKEKAERVTKMWRMVKWESAHHHLRMERNPRGRNHQRMERNLRVEMISQQRTDKRNPRETRDTANFPKHAIQAMGSITVLLIHIK